MDKICTKCNLSKDMTDFTKDSKKKDGHYSSCKVCNNSRIAMWHSDPINSVKFAEYQKQWKQINKHTVRTQRLRWRNRQTIQYKLANTLRIRTKIALRTLKTSFLKELHFGCSIEELKVHLESKFQLGMTWQNWGTGGWELDHIRPLHSFDLTLDCHIDQANHYTNLQPLWATQNRIKGGKWNG